MTKKPISVLFITSDINYSTGVGRCLYDLIRSLDPMVVRSHVVCEFPGENETTIAPLLREINISVDHRKLSKWLPSPHDSSIKKLYDLVRSFRTIQWSISHLIKKYQIDLIYSNGLPVIDGAISARRSKIPHIWHIHESARNNSDLKKFLPASLIEKLVEHLSSHVIVNSNFLRHQFSNANYSPSVVFNGVQAYETVPQKNSIRKELGASNNTLLITSIGTINPRKNQKMLISVATDILKNLPNTLFLIIGGEVAHYADDFRKEIHDKNLEESFFILGERNDIPDLLRQTDLLLHTANQETFGRVIVEAMMTETPVVSTDCGGPSEIIENNRTGFIVEVNDSFDMARKAITILTNKPLSEKLGRAGKERAHRQFGIDRYANRIQTIITDSKNDYP